MFSSVVSEMPFCKHRSNKASSVNGSSLLHLVTPVAIEMESVRESDAVYNQLLINSSLHTIVSLNNYQ